MADLDFRPQRRDALVRVLRAALRQTSAGSEVRLRGSLASGTAGPYSDIDLLWVVSDEDFPAALARLGDGLGRAHRVASVRVDPDFALSDRRRLVFVRLEDIPLFWRVDIEVRAASIADVEDYDTDNLAARSEEGWSRPASALNNAIGAVKALSVGDLAGFDGLVERAYERIGLSWQPGVDDQAAVVGLMDVCVAQDPALSDLADQVRQLLDALTTEVPLAGGYINEVVRIGHTVRRPVGPQTPFVHRLLGHLARVAYPAPRLIGIDRQGREVLGFIEGVTHSGGHSDEAELRAVMRLIRRLHDATEAVPGLSGPGEVVCHNDLSPRNTIYVDHEPVAFIDWDLAASGNRIRDVAHACWQFLDLGYPGCDPSVTAGLLSVMCDAYGLDDRSQLLPMITGIQEESASGIEALARGGEGPYIGLVDRGTPAALRRVRQWVLDNWETLESRL
ncbi:MAG: phosphotransferase [Acidimicrobiales bacterium]